MSNSYQFPISEKEIKILMEDGCTKSEAENHLKNGTIVFEHDDFVNHFNDYMDEWSIDESDPLWHKLRDMIETKIPAGDWGVVDYEGNTYYIMYAL